MEMNLRCDNYFVEDEAWHEAADRYADFLKQNRNKKVVLLELGVGFNTPIIIRFPFEKMVRENKNVNLVRLNLDEAVIPESFGKRGIGINRDLCIGFQHKKRHQICPGHQTSAKAIFSVRKIHIQFARGLL